VSAPRATRGLPALYGIVHALVDLTCVTVVFRALPRHELVLQAGFYLVLGYDVIAFAGQAILGPLTDWVRAPKAAALLASSSAAA